RLQAFRMGLSDDASACDPARFPDPDWRLAAQLVLTRDTDKAARLPAVAACLVELEQEHRPGPTVTGPAMRRRRPDLGQALADLFRQPVKVDPGQGEWPEHISHTCNKGQFVATVRPDETTISKLALRHWRDHRDKQSGVVIERCEGCYYTRVKRESRKLLAELGAGTMWLVRLPSARAAKLITAFRKRKERGEAVTYCRYPLAGGYDAIINNQGEGEAITTSNRADIFTLVTDLADTPQGKRLSSSGGYGLDWQGTKGDGRQKSSQVGQIKSGDVLQYIGSGKAAEVAQALGGDIRGLRSVTIEIDAVEAVERLYLVPGISLILRNGSLESALGANVTDKGQEETQENPLSLIRDIPPELPLFDTPEPALSALLGGAP
ncbi:MAG: hypothetical protein KDE09_23555, partial [Anaerolineales bacterium]|nr:hypothetical protein [Anaerolineales bacterium]